MNCTFEAIIGFMFFREYLDFLGSPLAEPFGFSRYTYPYVLKFNTVVYLWDCLDWSEDLVYVTNNNFFKSMIGSLLLFLARIRFMFLKELLRLAGNSYIRLATSTSNLLDFITNKWRCRNRRTLLIRHLRITSVYLKA